MAARKRTRRRTASQLRSYRRRVGKRTAAHRRRDSRGRFLNPFDTKGFWHKSSGKYGTPPNRGGRPAKRRRAFTSRVAAGRRRTKSGRFRNPVDTMDLVLANPFTDRAGRVHRNDGKFARTRKRKKTTHSRKRSSAAKRRRRDSQGRFLNPFRDRAGRMHRNDGKFMKSRKRKAAKSHSKRAVAARRAAARRQRTAKGRFKNPFANRAKRMYNPSRRRALPAGRRRR